MQLDRHHPSGIELHKPEYNRLERAREVLELASKHAEEQASRAASSAIVAIDEFTRLVKPVPPQTAPGPRPEGTAPPAGEKDF